jgi:hypothetical protein
MSLAFLLQGRGGSPNRPQAIELNRPYLFCTPNEIFH